MNKKKTIRFRCTTLEKEIIKKKAEASNKSISEFVRDISLGRKVTYKLTEEELEILKDLHKFNNNFSRIGNLIKNKKPELMDEINTTKELIKKALAKFQ